MTRSQADSFARLGVSAAIFLAGTALPGDAAAKTLFDYFQPTPIVNQLTSAGWGATNVKTRDQDNGLEDKANNYSYWDGRIVKATDGKYHLFGSRWDESLGHWSGWPGSICVHAVSDSNPLGPYVDKGACYSDQSGKGHNVMAGQMPDNKYFILVSETRPASIYTSSSLDGPWTFLGQQTNDHPANPVNGSAGSNTTLWVKTDGSYLMTDRHGVILISNNILGPFKVQGDTSAGAPSVYPTLAGMVTTQDAIEDPCLWYSGGQYHMLASWPLDRKMYHLMSKDGITNWQNMGLAVDATKPFIRYTNGTTNVWNKLERPQVYLEDGHVKYFTFAAIDVDKGNDLGNDTHGSKIVVVPFDGVTFDAEISGGGATGGTGGTGAGGTGTGGKATGGTATGGRATGGLGSGGLASGGRSSGGTISAAGETATGGFATSGGTGGSSGSPENCNCRTAPSEGEAGKLFGFAGLCLLAVRRRRDPRCRAKERE